MSCFWRRLFIYFYSRNIGTFGSIINTELAWLAAANFKLVEGMAFLNETNYEEDLTSLLYSARSFSFFLTDRQV